MINNRWIILLFLGFMVPGLVSAYEPVSPDDEIQRLTLEYQALRQEAQVLADLRKPLPDYLLLIHKIESLKEELEALGVILTEISEENLITPFRITRQGNTEDPGPVQNGDELRFEAEVEHPASDPPIPTQLFWQVYDSEKRPIEGLSKSIDTYETGGKKIYSFGFIPDHFNNGDYYTALTHRLVSNPEVAIQSVYPFTVFQAAVIEKILVTDGKGDLTHRSEIKTGISPQIFVYYNLAKDSDRVMVEMTAKELVSGKILENVTVERPREGEKPPYRVGLGLPESLLKGGDHVSFQVKITSQDRQTLSASTEFQIIQQEYELRIVAPKVIMGNQSADYTIIVPDDFKGPFSVRAAGGGLEISKSSDPLQGQILGTASASDSTHTLSFLVRDAEGRSARGTASITVRGLDPDTISSMNQPQPVLQTGPPASLPTKKIQEPDNNTEDNTSKDINAILNTYNQEMIRIKAESDAKKKEIEEKYAPRSYPEKGTSKGSAGQVTGNEQKQGNCRSFVINADHCRDSFYKCMAKCPTTGTHSSIQACHDNCGEANRNCRNALCPGGKVTGVGWNLTCTQCQ